MTAQPPALHGSRKVTVLGWSAVLVAVIVLIVLAVALVNAYAAANGGATSAPGSPLASASAGASATATPAESTTVPTTEAPMSTAAPNPADAAQPGEEAAPVEQPPVALTESATVVPQVVFALGALEAVDGLAQGPGEVAGPALRFTLTVRNDTAASVSLAATVVNLYAGVDQAPSMDLAEPGGVPLPDEVKPGQSATGTFVFAVPLESRDPVKITVDYSVGIPVVVFQGPAPR